jgi:hypothetical protein
MLVMRVEEALLREFCSRYHDKPAQLALNLKATAIRDALIRGYTFKGLPSRWLVIVNCGTLYQSPPLVDRTLRAGGD